MNFYFSKTQEINYAQPKYEKNQSTWRYLNTCEKTLMKESCTFIIPDVTCNQNISQGLILSQHLL